MRARERERDSERLLNRREGYMAIWRDWIRLVYFARAAVMAPGYILLARREIVPTVERLPEILTWTSRRPVCRLQSVLATREGQQLPR